MGPFWQGIRSKSSSNDRRNRASVQEALAAWRTPLASRHFLLSHRQIQSRAPLAGVAVAARVNVTLDKLRAVVRCGSARLAPRIEASVRATVLKRRHGRHVRNICMAAGYVLPRWESGPTWEKMSHYSPIW